MAHLGRRLRDSGSVIDLSQLPSPSPSGSYHLNHSDSALAIRMLNKAMCLKPIRVATHRLDVSATIYILLRTTRS